MAYDLIIEQPPLEGYHHIERFLDKGEGQAVEYKQRLSRPEKIAKTICAFANTEGGILLIGVKDDKTVIGADPGQEAYTLHEALLFINPYVKVKLTEVFLTKDEPPYPEVIVLIVEVDPSEEKPHQAKDLRDNWHTYIRHKDQTLIAGSRASKQLETEPAPVPKPKMSKNLQRLMGYLKMHERITQKEYADLVNISDRRARRELMEALDYGLIRVLEHEKEDVYVL